ncbi:MAG: hypothetical protein NT020_01275 [Chloroflexales bacterium]|nr:hypothetical protein [Chloroflexales bacterium]
MKVFFTTATYPMRRLWAGLVAFLIAVGSGHFYAIDEDLMYGTSLRMLKAIYQLFDPTIITKTTVLTQYGPMQSILALFTMPFGAFWHGLDPPKCKSGCYDFLVHGLMR